MSANHSARSMEVFHEVFEGLPRQGPGSRACTLQALSLCRDLVAAPAILDLGCGVGAQTLVLAANTTGTITAVDLHAPNIARLNETVAEAGLGDRIRPEVEDFGALSYAPASFDLLWSEGALYNLGMARALPMCWALLRPGGYLAFTDAVWRTPDPPAAVRAIFVEDYPAMGRVSDTLQQIADAGLALEGHFTVPDAAWWTDFYTPMGTRIEELRAKYPNDPEALRALAAVAEEPRMHEEYGEHYAYEFFVCRRPS